MPFFKRGFGHLLGIVLLAGALTACATAPDGSIQLASSHNAEAAGDEDYVNDPFEVPNRIIFAFNVGLDQLVLQPVAVTYRDGWPDELKVPFENFITNLFMPLSFIHAMLQGDFERAEMAAARFITAIPTLLLANTDPDNAPVFEDAGQTFAVWGAGDGPYIMLPVLGPSNLRDTTGTVVDFFIDPLSLAFGSEATIGRGVSSAVIQRSNNIEQVRSLQRDSVDYYAAVRSLHRQRRQAEIRNGDIDPTSFGPSMGLEFDDEPALKQRSDATTQ